MAVERASREKARDGLEVGEVDGQIGAGAVGESDAEHLDEPRVGGPRESVEAHLGRAQREREVGAEARVVAGAVCANARGDVQRDVAEVGLRLFHRAQQFERSAE